MKKGSISLTNWLFLLALGLALALRLGGLNAPALSDSEAGQALQALELARGGRPILGGQPGYVLPTAVFFFLFQANEWSARLWPALTGSLTVIAAWLLAARIGALPALILAFLAAIDPTLLAASRQAGAQGSLIGLSALGLAAWSTHRERLTGAAGALALFAGPGLLPGWAGAGLAAWVTGTTRNREEGNPSDPRFDWKRAAFSGLAVFLAAGTLFWLVPGGLGAAVEGVTTYLRGWAGSASLPAGAMWIAYLFYEAFAIGFALIGLVFGVRRKNPLVVFLGIWWATALVLGLVYPSRGALDLSWAALPMITLAALGLAECLPVSPEDRLPVLGQAVLVFVLSIFIYNNIVGFTNAFQGNVDMTFRWIGLAGAVVVMAIITVLVGMGWSAQVAVKGLAWGAGIALFLLYVSCAFHAGGLTARSEAELLRLAPPFTDADLVTRTLRDTAQWRSNTSQPPQVVVVGEVDSPAVRWALRDLPNVTYSPALSPQSQAEILLTGKDSVPELEAGYRGQEMRLKRAPVWDLILPGEWLRWFVFRSAPLEEKTLILWVRTDLFPGGNPSNGGNQPNPVQGPNIQ